MIRKVVNEVRSEAGLPLATNWPVLTFEKFVYTVLVRIAMEDENFLELTEAQVREVLYRVGYLEIEPGYERSEEHTSELQSIMRISYDVVCLKNTHLLKEYHKYLPRSCTIL